MTCQQNLNKYYFGKETHLRDYQELKGATVTAKQGENKNLAKHNEADSPRPKPLGKRNGGSQPLSREDQNYPGRRNPDTPLRKGTKERK